MYFARDGRATSGNGIGEWLGQIKIAPDAFVVGTIEAEHGLGVPDIDGVLDCSALRDAFGVVEGEIDRQGLQLLERVGEAGRVFDPLTFLLPVFRAGAESLLIHDDVSILFAALREHATTKARRRL
jgi:hypothetical protein